MTPGQARFQELLTHAGVGCRHFEALKSVPCVDSEDVSTRAASSMVLPWAPGVVVVDECTSVPRPHESISQLVHALYSEMRAEERDTKALDGFARQLTQSYEELNLLYRAAELLTSSEEPLRVVQVMADELRGTLQCRWLAVVFASSESVLLPLREKLLWSGVLPCDQAAVIANLPTTGDGPLLVPGRHPLATLAGAEVLTEQLTYGQQIIGTLVAGGREGDGIPVGMGDIQLFGAAANFLGLYHQNASRFAQQRVQYLGMLKALSATVDAKDPYTRGHSDRVGLLAWQLATSIGYDSAAAEVVHTAGLLHDIGKIGVPDSVLRKAGRLSDAEFAEIKAHPTVGYGILKDVTSLTSLLPGVLHHHERWDGCGYPTGLSGDQIPMVARILALADTFDAMSSSRAYRKAMDRAQVLAELAKCAGTQFDPALVVPFLALDFTDFDQMLNSGVALSAAA